MTKGRRTLALFLLSAALVLVVLGQFYFFRRRDYLWDGVVFHGVAVVCFLLAWRQTRPEERPLDRSRASSWSAWLREHPVQVGLVALGSCLSLIATLLSWGRAPDQPTRDVVLLWGLALGAVGLAALWPGAWPSYAGGSWPERLRRVERQTWLEAITLLALTGLALSLRVTALASVPYTLGGDEAWHGLLARQVLSGQIRNPFVMGYMSMPTFFYWPLSWSLGLVGNNLVGLRFPATLIGTATVALLYLFARERWGRRLALLATLFLATYDYHLHYSRLGANNVWDPLFVLLTLWALDRGIRELENWEIGPAEQRALRSFLFAGLVTGLSFYFYTGARLLPLLVATYTAFVWLKERGQMKHLGLHLLLLTVAFLVAAGPMLGYALSHPDEWNARINQVGIIQSGWLAREPGLTGKSTLQILAEQFLRAAGAFHVFPDRTVWYGADRPLLGFLAGAFAMLGLAWAASHWRQRCNFLLLLWFWSVIIAGGMLTESPPSSQRLVIAIPAVALLVATGLEQTAKLAWQLLPSRWQRWQNIALGLLITVLAVSNVHFYFGRFTPSRRYGSENGETATMIGHYLRGLGGDYQAYFFGAPRIYWSFGTMAFLAPGVSGYDVTEPLTAPPDFVDRGRKAVFIFLPERAAELSWVQQTCPHGILREFRDAAGKVRFLVYEVPCSNAETQRFSGHNCPILRILCASAMKSETFSAAT